MPIIDREGRTGRVELFLLILAAAILLKLLRAVLRLSRPSDKKIRRGLKRKEELPPPDSPARWLGAGEKASFRGFSLPGFVYYGGRLLDSSGKNDPCLINPHLEVSEAEGGQPVPLKNISYSELSPRQRFSYLAWLSDDMEDPGCEPWCVLLFLFGLERRLFVDGPRGRVSPEERKSIVLEVLRLLQIYGEISLLKGYFLNLLAMEWAVFDNGSEFPWYLDFPGIRGKEIFPAIAARLADHGLPLPGETALQWLIDRPEACLPTATRSHPELFRQVFLLRYSQRHEKGIPLHPGRTPLILEYRGANPSLGGRMKIRVSNLPNPFVIRTPLQKIAALGEECGEELEPYSRKLLELQDGESPAPRTLLSPDLLPILPEGEAIRRELLNLCASGPALVRLRLLEMILADEPPQENGGGFCGLRTKAAALGFGIFPETEGVALALSDDPVIVLYEGTILEDPSKEYLLLAALLHLGALAAQALGSVSSAKEEVFRSLIIGDEKLSEEEKTSLSALLLWSFRTPRSARQIRGVLKDFTEEGKNALARVLLTVAGADGTPGREEIIQLEKLWAYLVLERKNLSEVRAAFSFGSDHSGEREKKASAVQVLERERILLRKECPGKIQKILAGTYENKGGETLVETNMIEDREDLFPDCEYSGKAAQTEKTEKFIDRDR